MVSIKVLGPGCANCERVELHVIKALEQIKSEHPDIEVTVEKVKDTMKYLEYGLIATPGLVINEKLVSGGRIPSPEEIKRWLEAILLDGNGNSQSTS